MLKNYQPWAQFYQRFLLDVCQKLVSFTRIATTLAFCNLEYSRRILLTFLQKLLRVRPTVPWYGDEIREAKRERRRRERKWRSTKLPSDHTKFKDQRRTVSQMLITAKSRHFCDKIEECAVVIAS